jgi:hypothetical protein
MALPGRLQCLLQIRYAFEAPVKRIALRSASSRSDGVARELFLPKRVFSTTTPKAASLIDFNDHQKAFENHTLTELVRAWAILNVCSLNVIAKNSERVRLGVCAARLWRRFCS